MPGRWSFRTIRDTGLSRGDLIDLRWSQVDLDHGLLRVVRSKTQEPVVVPLTQRLRDLLRELALGSTPVEHVFRTRSGRRWSVSSLRRHFARAKRLAGIDRPFRFHDMRHDFASALAKEGVSLQVIAALLGHTSQRMTARYAHLHPETLRAAVSLFDER